MAATHQKFTEQDFHRKMAVDLFNLTWAFLDKPDRNALDEDRMIHSAHASRYHWEVVGTNENLAIGEWQISRVYAVLKRAEPALFHSRRSLHICEQSGLTGFCLAYAHEAMARALSLSGDQAAAATSLKLAKEVAQTITEPEDKKLVLEDLKSIQV
jgi:hypothetical protein